MKYGYFDDDKAEYVITRPDTPTSWSNYLGSTVYGVKTKVESWIKNNI